MYINTIYNEFYVIKFLKKEKFIDVLFYNKIYAFISDLYLSEIFKYVIEVIFF